MQVACLRPTFQVKFQVNSPLNVSFLGEVSVGMFSVSGEGFSLNVAILGPVSGEVSV